MNILEFEKKRHEQFGLLSKGMSRAEKYRFRKSRKSGMKLRGSIMIKELQDRYRKANQI